MRRAVWFVAHSTLHFDQSNSPNPRGFYSRKIVRKIAGERVPLLVTYRDRPVKYHRRIVGGLLLIFYGERRGDAGERLIVSQDDWHRHGCRSFYPAGKKPDVRAPAAPLRPSC